MDLFHKEWHLIGTINTDHRWLPKMIVHGEESVGEKTFKEENSQLSILPLRGSLGAKKVYQGFLLGHWWKGLW